jgi:hypothetical protein
MIQHGRCTWHWVLMNKCPSDGNGFPISAVRATSSPQQRKAVSTDRIHPYRSRVVFL